MHSREEKCALLGTEITRQDKPETRFRDHLPLVENVLTKSLLSVFDSVINTPTNQSGKHRISFKQQRFIL